MESEIKEGYLYAFSNICMPGILKVGMTERTPEERLKDANRSDTWRPPAPYKLECAIKVNNPLKKENILHRILEKYVDRINPEREFFKISIEEIRLFFSLFDSEIYVIKNEEDVDMEEVKDKDIKNKKSRDMKRYFKDKQNIKHNIDGNSWIGEYDYDKNAISYNGKHYKNPTNFAQDHYKQEKPGKNNINGWTECECEIDGRWISISSLSELEY